jgi:hypothetical protein
VKIKENAFALHASDVNVKDVVKTALGVMHSLRGNVVLFFINLVDEP